MALAARDKSRISQQKREIKRFLAWQEIFIHQSRSLFFSPASKQRRSLSSSCLIFRFSASSLHLFVCSPHETFHRKQQRSRTLRSVYLQIFVEYFDVNRVLILNRISHNKDNNISLNHRTILTGIQNGLDTEGPR